jgi:hypothetical protein
MSFFKEFSSLLPYLQSVRTIKEYLSFDILFPSEWKIPKKYVDEQRVVEQETTKAGSRFFSFVCEINETEFERISNNIKSIIKYNLDREAKDKLFEDKVNELKSIFEKQNLNNLKNLKFELKNNMIEFEGDEEELRTNRSLSETDGEG